MITLISSLKYLLMVLPFHFCQRCMIIRLKTFSMFLFIFKKREKVFSRLLYLKHMTVAGFLPLCLLPLLLSIEKIGQRQAPTQCILSPPSPNPSFFAYPGKFSQSLKIHFPFTLEQVLSLSPSSFTSFYWTSTVSLPDIGAVKINKPYFWWESPYSFTGLHITVKMTAAFKLYVARLWEDTGMGGYWSL